MRENSPFVFISGGLLTPAVLAEALSDNTKDAAFDWRSFANSTENTSNSTQHAEALQEAWELACDAYDLAVEQLDGDSQEEGAATWLRDLLFTLGWVDVDTEQTSSPRIHRGPAPLLLTSCSLDDLGENGGSYHDVLQDHLNTNESRWGIASSPRQLRVLREFHHTTIKAFVGFDLESIFESRDFPAFRAMYRLAHPTRFQGGEDCPLERLFKRSQKEGIAVGKALQVQVRAALHELANGLIGPALKSRMADPATSREVFRELLLLTYRILFLLFAEQRGMMPTAGLYADSYSLERLLRLVDHPRVSPHHHDLWEGLKVTFAMVTSGDPVTAVFGYNGRLFNPEEIPHLRDATCPNSRLLKALKSLAWVEVGGLTQRINYGLMAQAGIDEQVSGAGLDELGSVYESLLGYTLRVSDRNRKVEDRSVASGEVYLASLSTERKDLGAFYTPPELVDFVLSESLDPLIAERFDAAGEDSEARELALLDLRVCDPACGAGTFLVAAIDRIAIALARVRIPDGRPSDRDVQRARRDVLSHCIYGVDKDRFAVELCKFALWVHCAVKDLPLSFLDHRIQHGDSLVGWPLGDLPREIPSEAFNVPSAVSSAKDATSKKLKSFLQASATANDNARQLVMGRTPPPIPDLPIRFPDVLAEDERVPADVIRKTKAYHDLLRSAEYARWKATADLWAAAFFWNPDLGAAPSSADYWHARDGDAPEDKSRSADELLSVFPVFHWPLRFPEIAKRGGFDCLVGNPPWEQFENREQEWFGANAPDIGALRGSQRKTAIEQLRKDEPQLYRSWNNYVQANLRIAEYARNCGRFTASGGKPNTYLLFAEIFADFISTSGIAGVVVKSGLGFDQSASAVFQRLTDAGRVIAFNDFVNGGTGGRIFPAVGDPVRFACVSFSGSRTDAPIEVTTYNFTIEQARTRPRVEISPALLRVFNPSTRTLVSYRTEDEYRVAEQIHRTQPLLDCDKAGVNPWGLRYAQMFNSTSRSHQFHRPEKLLEEGWILGSDMVFRRPMVGSLARKDSQEGFNFGDRNESSAEERALPLYEGQLANRYDHRSRTYEGYEGPTKYGKKPGIPYCSDEQKANADFEIEPRYWMCESDALPRIRKKMGDRIMLGFRDVAAWYSDRRCAKAVVLPQYPPTDTLPVLGIPKKHAMQFTGIFNATTFDFLEQPQELGNAVPGKRS